MDEISLLDSYSNSLKDSSPDNLTLQQAILWLRPISSQHLINKAELLGINPMPFISSSIKIICDMAEYGVRK